jgi:hypothetical protein
MSNLTRAKHWRLRSEEMHMLATTMSDSAGTPMASASPSKITLPPASRRMPGLARMSSYAACCSGVSLPGGGFGLRVTGR